MSNSWLFNVKQPFWFLFLSNRLTWPLFLILFLSLTISVKHCFKCLKNAFIHSSFLAALWVVKYHYPHFREGKWDIKEFPHFPKLVRGKARIQLRQFGSWICACDCPHGTLSCSSPAFFLRAASGPVLPGESEEQCPMMPLRGFVKRLVPLARGSDTFSLSRHHQGPSPYFSLDSYFLIFAHMKFAVAQRMKLWWWSRVMKDIPQFCAMDHKQKKSFMIKLHSVSFSPFSLGHLSLVLNSVCTFESPRELLKILGPTA